MTPLAPFAPEAIERFVADGYLRLDEGFAAADAAAAVALLRPELGSDPAPPALWPRPHMRLGYYDQEPFRATQSSPRLHAALDQLAGAGRWRLPWHLGSFVARFPSAVRDGSMDHWHADISFPGPDSDSQRPNDYETWRANWCSRGRMLTLLMLFTDVGEADAPTLLRVGSHRVLARLLRPAGEAGLSTHAMNDVAADCPVVTATGPAGTVYLCHPFLIHAGQPHQGTRPRILAQPMVLPREPVTLERADGDYSPVERAIRLAHAEAAAPRR